MKRAGQNEMSDILKFATHMSTAVKLHTHILYMPIAHSERNSHVKLCTH